jgi:Ni/Co efflux regulator RcnB
MKKLIAVLIAAVFASVTFTAFAADTAKPAGEQKQHQKKKGHKAEPKAPASSEKK